MITTDSGTTVLAGIGSTVLGDAMAGLKVIDMAERRFGGYKDIEFKKLAAGGMDLLYAMEGYSHAVLVESRYVLGFAPGELLTTYVGSLSIDRSSESCTGSDYRRITTLLKLGKQCGCRMPEDVFSVTISRDNNHFFGERVADGFKPVFLTVLKLIEQQMELWLCCND
jgi:Ni,Fe-hydrogenase maturation factor